jgi:hypothetical protein
VPGALGIGGFGGRGFRGLGAGGLGVGGFGASVGGVGEGAFWSSRRSITTAPAALMRFSATVPGGEGIPPHTVPGIQPARFASFSSKTTTRICAKRS